MFQASRWCGDGGACRASTPCSRTRTTAPSTTSARAAPSPCWRSVCTPDCTTRAHTRVGRIRLWDVGRAENSKTLVSISTIYLKYICIRQLTK